MKGSELRQKKDEELTQMEANLRRERAELALKMRMGAETKTARRGELGREIARILTIRRERGKTT